MVCSAELVVCVAGILDKALGDIEKKETGAATAREKTTAVLDVDESRFAAADARRNFKTRCTDTAHSAVHTYYALTVGSAGCIKLCGHRSARRTTMRFAQVLLG